MKHKKIEDSGAETWLEVSRILLQLDLEGHSQWFSEANNKREALDARVDLAKRIEALMREREFEEVYWAGDGGMYACEPTKLASSYDGAVDIARAVAREFQLWRDQNEDRARLRIRISIHCGFPVYIHDKPGYWTSEHLNAFAKHEREIAIAGTIAITDAVRERLDPRVPAEFPDSTRRQVLIGSVGGRQAVIRYVYYSPIEGEDAKLRKSQKAFGTWMKQLCDEIGVASPVGVGPQSAIRATVGEATVLQFAPDPGATFVVDLKRSTSAMECALTDAELETLDQLADDQHKQHLEVGLEDEQKVSPERVIFPLTDFPCMTIEWHSEVWSKARAFHKQLTDNEVLWRRLATSAADIQSKGLPFPGILCVHVVARVVEQNGIPYVLLCQRNVRGREDTYHKGLWSCSIEEQAKPGETIEQCARRGISEELLGPGASEHIGINIVALFLDARYLNLTLLAVADIPLSYSEVVERWRGDSLDKDEHRQIVGLPVQRDIVIACGNHGKCGGLPENVRRNCLVSDKEVFDSTTQWQLHPTSLFRLATALWLQSDDQIA